jgi:methylenetetrahydrofolate reductase (NADPH)
MARIGELLAAGKTFSMEFFPPKNPAGWLGLGHTLAQLETLSPDFVDITYGAGGSTRTNTHDLVSWVHRQTTIPPMAHLTCQGHTRDEIRAILTDYQAENVVNILALGGDPPADGSPPPTGDYVFAEQLVEDILDFGGFSIGVAAHPELHPRSADRRSDRRHLASKMRLAEFAITQFFFEVDHYLALVDDLQAHGVDKPVLPGIMPVTNLASVSRMAQLSGAEIPGWLVDKLTKADADVDKATSIGIEIATELCQGLLDAGAPGLHFYTLNRSYATTVIWNNLGLPTSSTGVTTPTGG